MIQSAKITPWLLPSAILTGLLLGAWMPEAGKLFGPFVDPLLIILLVLLFCEVRFATRILCMLEWNLVCQVSRFGIPIPTNIVKCLHSRMALR